MLNSKIWLYHSTQNNAIQLNGKFSMDGTMTIPIYDFPRIRDLLGLQPGADLFHGIRSLEGELRSKAEARMLEIEDEGLKSMQVGPGFHELMKYLETLQFPKAILTRNTVDSLNHFLKHHSHEYQFHPTLSRSSALPIKPSPEPLLHISKSWGIPINEILMVGDGPEDMLCASNAGAFSCLMKTKDNAHLTIDSHICVSSLNELFEILLVPS
ncbi:hypothetical protein HMI55_004738 [Coelomomyces lativittatus]|nr:hypothetical protein HMI56_006749 [Coelomomyces lativittatus]KAJ1514351.1 hypothetical protein HMI55_004738 [Coelomomyces lativittatus]